MSCAWPLWTCWQREPARWPRPPPRPQRSLAALKWAQLHNIARQRLGAAGASAAGSTGADVAVAAEGSHWQTLAAFVRWTANEVYELAVFQVTMDSVEKLMASATGDPMRSAAFEPSPEEKVYNVLVIAFRKLSVITNDWRQWMVDHFGNQTKYGVVSIDDHVYLRFKRFREQVSGLSTTVSSKLTPALVKASKQRSMANISDIKHDIFNYSKDLRAISEGIRDKEPLMVTAGLKSHLDEIKQVIGMFESV